MLYKAGKDESYETQIDCYFIVFVNDFDFVRFIGTVNGEKGKAKAEQKESYFFTAAFPFHFFLRSLDFKTDTFSNIQSNFLFVQLWLYLFRH